MRISRSSDTWAAVLYVCIGATFFYLSLDYNPGSATRPGAGAFPIVISALLILIGVVIGFRSLFSEGSPIEAFDMTSAVPVVLAVLVAGLALRSFGLVVAVPAAVAISSLAAGSFRPARMIAMSIFLTAFCYLVFIAALGLNIPFLPGQD